MSNDQSFTANRAEIQKRLERIAREGFGYSPEVTFEFVFHMTDWLEDLDGLVQMYQDPDPDPEEASQLLMGILFHVPQHLAAAAVICTGFPVTDVFKLGAVEGDGVRRRSPGDDYTHES